MKLREMVFGWSFEWTETQEQQKVYYYCLPTKQNHDSIRSWRWHDFIRMSSLVKRVWLPGRKVARLASVRDLINHFPEEYNVTRALLAFHRCLHNEPTDNKERKSPLLPWNRRFIVTLFAISISCELLSTWLNQEQHHTRS